MEHQIANCGGSPPPRPPNARGYPAEAFTTDVGNGKLGDAFGGAHRSRPVDQLQEFPSADHDDGPDALEMALRLATETLAGTHNDGLGNRLPVG